MSSLGFNEKKKKAKHVWNTDEDEILNELVIQFGLNYEAISTYLNDTFMTNKFNITEVRERWEYRINPKINRGPFTHEEAKKLYYLVQEQLLKTGSLWSEITDQFINRPTPLIQFKFKQIMYFIFRRLNLFFGAPEMQRKYNKRFSQIQDLTLLLIFYFAQQTLSSFYHNKYLLIIAQASKKLVPFVTYFIEIGYFHQENLLYYFDHRPFKNMQTLTSEEFSEIMEPIILMDSLNRIAFGQKPYDYGFIKRPKESKLLQKRDNCNFMQLDELPIENYQNFELDESKIERTINRKLRSLTILSKEEVQIIRNSEIAAALRPYQMTLSFRKTN